TGGLGRQFGKANLETSKALSICSSDIILEFPFQAYNARLRGWQRITTKLKHNNRNHSGSMGLETLRVDSPS
ncbi:hypothetical protein, partial [Vibrio cholerae]|uniref:hypothetical protein n=1 Tax=Vibrio cholerae TaxID=666 RepID=UPI001E2F357E